MILLTGVAAGCAHHRLYAPMQPDGWSAQPVAMACRFAPDADLDPATRTPVGDEGYYLYILTEAGDWDYSTRIVASVACAQPWGHSWLILESPENRLECGLNGNFGREKPRYDEGVIQKFRDGDPNPIVLFVGDDVRRPTRDRQGQSHPHVCLANADHPATVSTDS